MRLGSSERFWFTRAAPSTAISKVYASMMCSSNGYWWDFASSAYQNAFDSNSRVTLVAAAGDVSTHKVYRSTGAFRMKSTNMTCVPYYRLCDTGHGIDIPQLGEEIRVCDIKRIPYPLSATIDKDHAGLRLNVAQGMRLLLSVMTGLSSGGGSTRVKFRNIRNTTCRMDVSVGTYGDRVEIHKRNFSTA